MELVLEWKGWYGLNIETPIGMEGLHGLFVNFYDFDIYYIGKSMGKCYLFQESRRRYKALNKYLLEKRQLEKPLDRIALDKEAEEHCKKYLGILHDERMLDLIDSAEKLLIFLNPPRGNSNLIKEYNGVQPFKLVNNGEKSVLVALGLKTVYDVNRDGTIFTTDDNGNVQRIGNTHNLSQL
jgi:hypothetical protein